MIVFVDFDGTITDVDTFDALVRDAVGDEIWDAVDAEIMEGRRTLRDVLVLQAAHDEVASRGVGIRRSERRTVDPAFPPFVRAARARGVEVRVVSSGVGPIIRATLARAGVEVPILANDVDFAPHGWTICVHRRVGERARQSRRRARAPAPPVIATVFVGDGISDFGAAHEAERCFAKAGRALEAYCAARDIACTAFDSFAEIEAALFPGVLDGEQ